MQPGSEKIVKMESLWTKASKHDSENLQVAVSWCNQFMERTKISALAKYKNHTEAAKEFKL